jgi:hypothetical protein
VGGIHLSEKGNHNMTNTTALMNRSKHMEVILDLIAEGGDGMAQRAEAARALHSITEEQFASAVDEVLFAHSDNDVEGAAMGVAAVGLAYPDHDAEEYLEACVRVTNLGERIHSAPGLAGEGRGDDGHDLRRCGENSGGVRARGLDGNGPGQLCTPGPSPSWRMQ